MIIPEGLMATNWLHRGFWEAKDTRDDLNDEISKIIKAGCPLDNTIFEDSRKAVLYQNNKEVNRFYLAEAQGKKWPTGGSNLL